MKLMFVTVMSLLMSNFAQAELPTDLERVGFIAGEVVSADPLCPPGARCITDGTSLRLRFTLGCLDQFGDYDYRRTEDGIVVAMIGLVSAKSKAVRCIRANTKDITLTLVNAFPPFNVEFMGQNLSVPVSEFSRR